MQGNLQRRRRAFAITAAVLWLLGVEVLPNLHLAFHGDDHTHEADGTIVLVSFDPHHHDDGTVHTHADPERPGDHRDDRDGGRDRLAFHPAPVGHAAAGIAHRAVALHQPPPPALAPVAVPHAETWSHAAPIERPTHAATARPTARGPPVT